MAQIVINEISDNYTYNIGTNSYATVALPITAAWGPAYMDPVSVYGAAGVDYSPIDLMLENTSWLHFPATQEGLESFVATYRGPESNYRLAGDMSYQMAMTLLTSGYDVLVCRVCPGAKASGAYTISGKSFAINAKYPGTFGNNLKVKLAKATAGKYWNIVVYVVDASGLQTAVENLSFVFDPMTSETLPTIDELESAFLDFIADAGITDDDTAPTGSAAILQLTGGTDVFTVPQVIIYDDGIPAADASDTHLYAPVLVKPTGWKENGFDYTGYCTGTVTAGKISDITNIEAETAPVWDSVTVYKKFDSATAISAANTASYVADLNTKGGDFAKIRYGITTTTTTPDGFIQGIPHVDGTTSYKYTLAWTGNPGAAPAVAPATPNDPVKLGALVHMEWVYNAAFLVYQLLQDKLNYAPQRIVSPGWDDQNITKITDGVIVYDASNDIDVVSPFHQILMQTAYYSRCATAMLDIPKSVARGIVYDESATNPGYAQMLARTEGGKNLMPSVDVNGPLYVTHSALFAPWGQYKYVGTSKMSTASPSLLAMLIQRAQILNQPLQYEWALPTNRHHNLKIGKMDYQVPKKLLDSWQTLEGVGVNVITAVPDLGTNLWGNSTLFEVPPAVYQALANLSTRYLVCAVENVAYRCGLAITWQYNNQQAYDSFYAGMTPILDTMKTVGAIDDYYMKMAADINGLDHVNANSVVGKIYLVVNGVINDITIDLIALPPGSDLSQFAE